MMEGQRASLDGGLDPELLADLGGTPTRKDNQHDDITAMLEGKKAEEPAPAQSAVRSAAKSTASHWGEEDFSEPAKAAPQPAKAAAEEPAAQAPAFAPEEEEEEEEFSIDIGDTPKGNPGGAGGADFSISLDDSSDKGGAMTQSTYLDATASANESVDLSASTPQTQGFLGPGGSAAAKPRGESVDVDALMKGDLLQISVTDPTKTGDGMNAYVSYTVKTKTSLKEFDDTEFTVNRRYRDFAWLQQALIDSHSGYIIPPIPEKQQLGRFNQEFLQTRRKNLEKFVNRIARHANLYLDSSFRTFLTASDDMLESAKKASEATKKHQASSSKTLGGMFRDFRTSIAGRGYSESYKDDILDNALPYLNGFGVQLNKLIKHSEASSKRRKEMGACLTDLALSANVLASQEKEYLSHAFTQMSQFTDRVSVISTEQGEKEEATWVESLRDYNRVVAQVKVALDSRQQNLIALHAAQHDLEQKKNKTESLRNNPKSTPQIIEAMEKSCQEAEEKLYATKDQYNRVADVLKTELRRFGTEKMHDFKDIMTTFINNQVEYSQRVTDTWAELIPELEANIPAGSSTPAKE